MELVKETLDSLVDKTYDWFFENPVVGGVLAGGSLDALMNLFMHVNNESINPLINAYFFCGSAWVVHKQLKASQIMKSYGINIRNFLENLKPKKTKRPLKRNLVQRVFDPLFEHSDYSAIALCYGVLIHTSYLSIRNTNLQYFLHEVANNHDNRLFNIAFYSTVTLFTSKKVFDWLGALFHSANIKQTFEYFGFQIRRNLLGQKATYEHYSKIINDVVSARVVNSYAGLCLSLGKTDEALELLKNSMYRHSTINLQPGKSISVLMGYREEVVNNMKSIIKEPKFLSSYMGLAVNFLSVGEQKAAISVINQFTSQFSPEDNIYTDAMLSEALFFANIGEYDLLSNSLRSLMSAKPDLLQQESNYNIFSINDSSFSNHTFRFRVANEPWSLDREKNFNANLKINFDKVNDDSNFQIINPPIVFGLEDFYYGVTIYHSGDVAFDYFSDKNNISKLVDLGRFLGRIQASNGLSEPKSIDEYFKDLDIRRKSLNDCAKLKPYINMFFDYMDVLFQGFDQIPLVADVDAHLFNWIVTSRGVVVKVDNQYRTPNNPLYDSSKLMEQGGIIPLNDFGDELRKSILRAQYSELENGSSMMGFDEFLVRKLQADPLKAMSYFMFSKSNSRNPLIVNAYLQNGLYSVQKLKRKLTSHNETTALDRIEESLVGIINKAV